MCFPRQCPESLHMYNPKLIPKVVNTAVTDVRKWYKSALKKCAGARAAGAASGEKKKKKRAVPLGGSPVAPAATTDAVESAGCCVGAGGGGAGATCGTSSATLGLAPAPSPQSAAPLPLDGSSESSQLQAAQSASKLLFAVYDHIRAFAKKALELHPLAKYVVLAWQWLDSPPPPHPQTTAVVLPHALAHLQPAGVSPCQHAQQATRVRCACLRACLFQVAEGAD